MERRTDLPDEMVDALVRAVLDLEPEDWADEDLRVMVAKVLRLQATVRELQAHHRRMHPGCPGPVVAQDPPATANIIPLRARDSRLAA